MTSVRLDRLLANLGYGSRREVQGLIVSGQVRRDGSPALDPGLKVALEAGLTDRLRVSGAPLDPPPPLTLIMHKPAGLVCSHTESGRSVYEVLPSRWRRRSPPISTVGRLDGETTGLLLLTDDGELLHKVISPRRHVKKRYLAELAESLKGDEAGVFASGTLRLEGEAKALAPALLVPLSNTSAHVTIVEGRYHQVRRMFEAVGNRVVRLRRDRIGGLDLPPDLPPGAWRLVTEEELADVFAVG